MEAIFRAPQPLDLDGNISENWKLFVQKFDYFLTATGLAAKTDEQKVAVFLNLIGDAGLELFNSFDLTEDQKKSLDEIKNRFEAHCAPKKNIIFERFLFNCLSQKEGQSFDSFLTELRKAVRSTEYKDTEDMIRDRIVMGVYDKGTQERLLRESDLSLDKAIKFCKAVEASRSQSKALQQEVSINEIFTKSQFKTRKQTKDKVCRYCGLHHEKGKCTAYGKICNKCKKRNHFAIVCMSVNKPESSRGRRNVYEVQEDDSASESEQFCINAISKQVGVLSNSNLCQKQAMWHQKVIVEGEEIEFKLDTGAEVSVLPMQYLKKMSCRGDIVKSNITLVAYGSDKFKIKPIGEVTLKCKARDKSFEIPFIVVNNESHTPLLGLNACLQLNLVKRVDFIAMNKFKTFEDVVNSYPMIFEGLGEFPTPHRIILKENATSRILPIRRIPQALHTRVKLKLEQMERDCIIAKVDEPTDWLNPLVIVEKKNKDLRLCLDPKYLNEAISREHFLIPTVDEIASKLSNKSFFFCFGHERWLFSDKNYR